MSLNPNDRIHWLTGCCIEHPHQIRSANLASVRLRAGALASALKSPEKQLSFGEHIPADARAAIVGKLGANDARRRGLNWLDEMRAFKKRGGKLVLDFTDDHLGVDSSMTPFYREAIGLTDLAVCSSPLLARNLADFFKGRIEVIPDAIEIGVTLPKTQLHTPVTVLWFGHASNLAYLVDFLPALAGERPLKLIILCNIEGLQTLQSLPLSTPGNVEAEGAVWSVPTMLAAANKSDLCIIPSNPSDRRKAGVSSNRLLTALAMGLPTAADRVDSYISFLDFYTDIRTPEFRSLLLNPLDFAEKVRAAQQGPVRGYSLEQIGRDWCHIVDEVLQTF